MTAIERAAYFQGRAELWAKLAGEFAAAGEATKATAAGEMCGSLLLKSAAWCAVAGVWMLPAVGPLWNKFHVLN